LEGGAKYVVVCLFDVLIFRWGGVWGPMVWKMGVRVVCFLGVAVCVGAVPAARPGEVVSGAGGVDDGLVERGMVVLGHLVKGVQELGRELDKLDRGHGPEYEYVGGEHAHLYPVATNEPLPENLVKFYSVVGPENVAERRRVSEERHAAGLAAAAAQRAVSQGAGAAAEPVYLLPRGGAAAEPVYEEVPGRRTTTL